MLRSLTLASLLVAAGLLATNAAAQAVTAKLKGSSLVVTGSESSDTLEIRNDAPSVDSESSSGVTVFLVPSAGTSVNDSTDPVSFDGVKKLKFTMNGGADELTFHDFNFTGSLSVNGGDGADQVSFLNCDVETGPIKLLGSAGDDTYDFTTNFLNGPVKISGSTGLLDIEADDTFFLSLSVKGGPGPDLVDLATCNMDTAKINLSAGDDQVFLAAVGEDQSFTVLLGPGVNSFSCTSDCSIGENLIYRGGTGDDTVTVQDTSIGERLDVKMFGGANSFTMASVASNMQVGEQLIVSGGSGTDEITLTDANGPAFPAFGVGSGAKLALQGGINDVSGTGFLQIAGMSITLGPQDDTVSLDGCQLQDKLSVALSNGTNSLTINDAVLQDDLFVTGGAGDDTVALTGSTSVAGQQKIHLGGGNNTQP